MFCAESHFSLRRQVAAINKLAAAGLYFWDYGNAFLLEASRAGTATRFYSKLPVQTRQVLTIFHSRQVSPTCALMKVCFLSGADVLSADKAAADTTRFRYPSYVQDIMGDIFSLGFGPFRCMYFLYASRLSGSLQCTYSTGMHSAHKALVRTVTTSGGCAHRVTAQIW